MGHAVVVCAGPDDLGKGGHECSLIDGNAGSPVANGDIMRTESQEPTQGSAMRRKFVSQASSKLLRAKSEYQKHDEEQDDDDDPWKNQPEDDPIVE